MKSPAQSDGLRPTKILGVTAREAFKLAEAKAWTENAKKQAAKNPKDKGAAIADPLKPHNPETMGKASSITPVSCVRKPPKGIRQALGAHDLDNSHWLLPGSKRVQDVTRNLDHFMVVPRIQHGVDRRGALRTGHQMGREARHVSQPARNWASHGSDALQTGSCGFALDPAAQ